MGGKEATGRTESKSTTRAPMRRTCTRSHNLDRLLLTPVRSTTAFGSLRVYVAIARCAPVNRLRILTRVRCLQYADLREEDDGMVLRRRCRAAESQAKREERGSEERLWPLCLTRVAVTLPLT